MIQTPNLQTLLTLTGGVSPVSQSFFVWGTPSRAFSVGTHGDWVINAPGVAPVHFFLRFDGKMLHLAGGPAGAPLSVSGVVVDQTWRPLPVFSVVVFGAAQLRVTCEPAAPRPASSPPAAPAGQAPAHAPRPVDLLESTVPLGDVRRLRTEPVVLAEAPQRPWPRSDPPTAGATQSAPPQGGPHPGATLVSPGGPQPQMSEVPSVRRELPPGSPEMESTLSDSGALKAHAKRVASEPKLARASADAYLEAVRQQAGIHGSTPPPQMAEPGRPGSPGIVAGASAPPRAPSAPPAMGVGPNVPTEPDDASPAKGPKEKSSWVMRVTLVLLPFAGYFAVFWEPGGDAPPAPQVSVVTPTASTPAATGPATPSVSAPVPATRPADSALASPTASGSTAPAASGAAPTASSSATPATSVVASARTSPNGATPSEVPSATISVAGAALPINVNRPRDALNAAFEGKLEEAVAHYDALATGPNAQVYSTAARLIRERAFRKP
jgi:hypothetical protein